MALIFPEASNLNSSLPEQKRFAALSAPSKETTRTSASVPRFTEPQKPRAKTLDTTTTRSCICCSFVNSAKVRRAAGLAASSLETTHIEENRARPAGKMALGQTHRRAPVSRACKQPGRERREFICMDSTSPFLTTSAVAMSRQSWLLQTAQHAPFFPLRFSRFLGIFFSIISFLARWLPIRVAFCAVPAFPPPPPLLRIPTRPDVNELCKVHGIKLF